MASDYKNWSTIHLFKYGETQIIGNNFNKKFSSSSLTKIGDVAIEVFSKKPQDVNASLDFHAVNIFNGGFADFLPSVKGEKAFRVPFNELNISVINDLVTELEALG